MFKNNLLKLKQKIKENNIDLAVITDDDSLYYFTGYYNFLHMDFFRPTILLVSKDDDSTLITPLLDVLLLENNCQTIFWKTGQYILPSILIQIIHNNQIIDSINSKKMDVFVNSILKKTNNQNIINIKENRKINNFRKTTLNYLLIIISVICIIYFLNKRENKLKLYSKNNYVKSHINTINKIKNLIIPDKIN